MDNDNSERRHRKSSDISDVIAKHFDCPICFNKYNSDNPAKALPCQHIFCLTCVDKMAKRGRIECPQCKVFHIIPKEGTKNFKTCYVLMQLIENVEEVKERKKEDGRLRVDAQDETEADNCRAENVLCNLAIHHGELLNNKVKEIGNQIEGVYGNAIQIVQESCEEAKKDAISDLDSLVERLEQIKNAVYQEAEKRAASETQRIEALKSEVNGAITAISSDCERKLAQLRQSRQMPGEEWQHYQDEMNTLTQSLTDIAKKYNTLSYKLVIVRESDLTAVVNSLDKVGEIHETEQVVPIDIKVGDGVVTLPDLRKPSFKIVSRDRSSSTPQNKKTQASRGKRNRNKEREHVLVKAFSEDTPLLLQGTPRIVLPSSTTVANENTSGARPKQPTKPPPLSPKPILNSSSNYNNINKFSFSSCSASRTPPPLPVRKHQQLAAVHEQPEPIPKVNPNMPKMSPCKILTADDINPLYPFGLDIARGEGKVAVASETGIRILEENGNEVTPRKHLRAQKFRAHTDVCCLPDRAILATSDNENDILRYDQVGICRGAWTITDMGQRLKNPVRSFGITCDRKGNYVYVSDRGNNCILVCSLDGILRKVIGQKGHSTEHLQDPLYLSLNQPPETVVYVADLGKMAIMTYTVDGDLIRSFSSQSAELGASSRTVALSRPIGVTVTPEGYLAVTDSDDHSVVVIDSINGTLIKRFGQYGSAPGEFDTPKGITFADDKLAVCDFENNRIQMFTWA